MNDSSRIPRRGAGAHDPPPASGHKGTIQTQRCRYPVQILPGGPVFAWLGAPGQVQQVAGRDLIHHGGYHKILGTMDDIIPQLKNPSIGKNENVISSRKELCYFL